MNSVKIIIIFPVLLLLAGCPKKPEIIYGNGTITVKGSNTVTNTMTITPGTTVNFEGIDISFIFFPSYQSGKLIIDGGKIIAQGIKDSPITFFTSNGGDYPYGDTGLYVESSASNESLLEYCEFKAGLQINISNSMNIKYCKFNLNSGHLSINNNSGCLINFNDFNNTALWSNNNSKSIIKYNNFNGIGIGMDVTSFPIIENNNITNSPWPAIARNEATDNSFNVTSNYVADCNGKTGVDTTGIQSNKVTYVSPRTTPAIGAGCGW